MVRHCGPGLLKQRVISENRRVRYCGPGLRSNRDGPQERSPLLRCEHPLAPLLCWTNRSSRLFSMPSAGLKRSAPANQRFPRRSHRPATARSSPTPDTDQVHLANDRFRAARPTRSFASSSRQLLFSQAFALRLSDLRLGVFARDPYRRASSRLCSEADKLSTLSHAIAESRQNAKA